MNLQMLTIENIEDLKEKGWKLDILRKLFSSVKGQCYPECKKIEIYKNKIRNKVDMNLTILHEFLHANDFEFENLNESGLRETKSYESLTEQRARYIHANFPEVLDKIKSLYIKC